METQEATQVSNQEVWKPVPDYKGLYEVSDMGRVRSLDRVVTHKNGERHRIEGRILKSADNGRGYLWVNLSRGGEKKNHYAHRLVYAAFVGPIPEGYHVDHINNQPGDNRLENLQAISPAENVARQKEFGTSTSCRVKNGTHNSTVKSHCPRNHPFYSEILTPWGVRQGKRVCMVCSRARDFIRRHETPAEWHWAVYDYQLERFLLDLESAENV